MNWNDKQEVLEAVKQDGRALKDASDELKDDKEIVLVAVKQSDKAFRHVSDELKADKDVVIAAISHKQAWLLRYSTEELLEAIKRNGNTLEPLSDLVMYGSTSKYASDEFRANKEVVFEAVKQNRYAKANKEFEQYNQLTVENKMNWNDKQEVLNY